MSDVELAVNDDGGGNDSSVPNVVDFYADEVATAETAVPEGEDSGSAEVPAMQVAAVVRSWRQSVDGRRRGGDAIGVGVIDTNTISVYGERVRNKHCRRSEPSNLAPPQSRTDEIAVTRLPKIGQFSPLFQCAEPPASSWDTLRCYFGGVLLECLDLKCALPEMGTRFQSAKVIRINSRLLSLAWLVIVALASQAQGKPFEKNKTFRFARCFEAADDGGCEC
jgi:hypothetical protein